MTKTQIEEHRILIVGAGEAGIGIADLLCFSLLQEKNTPLIVSRKLIWFSDSKGLVYKDRPSGGLNEEKRKYAHPLNGTVEKDLLSAVKFLNPSVLIGVSGQAQIFTPSILQYMASNHSRPIVFAFSNPTANAECTAEQLQTHTNGKGIFASGSPFPPFTFANKTFRPAQGNNVYVFPGIGKAVVEFRMTRCPQDLFQIAAKTLRDLLTEEEINNGAVYPEIERISDCSRHIAVACGKHAYDVGIANLPKPDDLDKYILDSFYAPNNYSKLTFQ